MTAGRTLPADVVVALDEDLDRFWDFFEFFEATHHGMAIMNPMSSEDLDVVVAAISPADGARVLDVACGHGELLLRLASRYPISGTGIDISPWQIRRAAQRAAAADLAGRIEWRLGRGEEVAADRSWDVVSIIGASWIWDGFEGTVRAARDRARPGGTVAVSDIQVRESTVPADLPYREYDEALGRNEQLAALDAMGIEVTAEIVSDATSWEAYGERNLASVLEFERSNPGAAAAEYVKRQRDWAGSHAGDSDHIGWTTWVGTVANS